MAAKSRTANRITETRGDKRLNITLLVVLGAFSVSVLYPLIYVMSASLSETSAVTSGEVWLFPIGFSTNAYTAVFESPLLFRSILNSLFYAGMVIAIGTFATMAGGYALSRRDLPGRNLLTFAFMITMLFSGGMIPTYLVVRDLGLLNTVWSMILPGAVSVWQLIISRAFFSQTIPHELLESAKMDGASDFTFFFKVVLPLSVPVIAVNMLLYGVTTWNAFFNGLIYLTDEELYPLQLAMRNILVQNTFDPAKMAGVDPTKIAEMQAIAGKLKYALIVIASIPPLLAYPFVQKHFVKGMMIGSVKG
ncbi:carbohydrate ABC transporter permease [Tessaracoccus flavescens]|uniref:Sugar ABC transporter permease n=1 Tax=Tessaracoccus flavescens TaxID=399497 RepID=A0A1Q2CXD9_9ACTN|nr:carbohydrate ABC transporter permease [Tessaracoccus flavescens]AQP50785.1 sugar ABC transporter permease [Tessaracoccus flavescens]